MNVQTPAQAANAFLDARQADSNAALRQRRADFSDRVQEDPEQLGEIVSEYVAYHRHHLALGEALKGALRALPQGSDAGRVLRLLVSAALAEKASEEIS